MIDLQLLQSKSGLKEVEDLIKEYKVLSVNDRYKKIFQAKSEKTTAISTAVWLLSLREKAEDKFSQAASMFFNDLSLEQASSEKVSDHIAKRFQSNWQVVDLTCGIGANALALAKRCQRVLLNDNNEDVLNFAKLNARTWGLENKVDFSLLNAEKLIDFLIAKDFSFIPKEYEKVEAIFLDPDRNRGQMTKTRSILNSSPNLQEILPKLFEITKNVAVKVSPAFDYREIKLLDEEPEIEIISENNNCKVAILWFGDFKRNRRSAACFRREETCIFDGPGYPINELALYAPQKYIYEVDKAISKAGLVDDLAKACSLNKISVASSFLSTEKSPEEMLEELDNKSILVALNVYELVRVFNCSFKELKKELNELNVERVEIKAKKHFLKPEEIYTKLKLKEGPDYTLLFLALKDNPKGVILMKRYIS